MVLYGCETWFLNRKDKRLIYGNIWASEGETDSNRKVKKLHNEELQNFTVKQICVYTIFAFVRAIFSCNAPFFLMDLCFNSIDCLWYLKYSKHQTLIS